MNNEAKNKIYSPKNPRFAFWKLVFWKAVVCAFVLLILFGFPLTNLRSMGVLLIGSIFLALAGVLLNRATDALRVAAAPERIKRLPSVLAAALDGVVSAGALLAIGWVNAFVQGEPFALGKAVTLALLVSAGICLMERIFVKRKRKAV